MRYLRNFFYDYWITLIIFKYYYACGLDFFFDSTSVCFSYVTIILSHVWFSELVNLSFFWGEFLVISDFWVLSSLDMFVFLVKGTIRPKWFRWIVGKFDLVLQFWIIDLWCNQIRRYYFLVLLDLISKSPKCANILFNF